MGSSVALPKGAAVCLCLATVTPLHRPLLARRFYHNMHNMEAGKLRFSPHVDLSTLSVLVQDSLGGLEVCDSRATFEL